MDKVKDGGADLTPESGSGRSTDRVPGLDLQHAELIETVWACERVWKTEGRVEAVVDIEVRKCPRSY